MRVICPTCQRGVDAADKYAGKTVKCPGCGSLMTIPAPVAIAVPAAQSATPGPQALAPPADKEQPAEQTLTKVHPAMARNRPWRFLIYILGVLAGLAGLFEWRVATTDNVKYAALAFVAIGAASGFALFTWYLRCRGTTLEITTRRAIFRQGLLNQTAREVRHADVRFLEVSQSLFQRLLGVGTLAISSAAHGEHEIVARGIPNPKQVMETIDGYRRD